MSLLWNACRCLCSRFIDAELSSWNGSWEMSSVRMCALRVRTWSKASQARCSVAVRALPGTSSSASQALVLACIRLGEVRVAGDSELSATNWSRGEEASDSPSAASILGQASASRNSYHLETRLHNNGSAAAPALCQGSLALAFPFAGLAAAWPSRRSLVLRTSSPSSRSRGLAHSGGSCLLDSHGSSRKDP